MCVGAEELYDKTIILSYLVPLIVILILTFLTDVYTFLFINYYNYSSIQCSTFHMENHSLNDICRICHTHCQYQCIANQKFDIPLKSTAISCILLASIYSVVCSFISIHDFALPLYKIYICIIIVCCYSTVNIPMIVSLSSRNNISNLAIRRQTNNTLAWNRTRRQQWEIKCALEDRIQTRTATDMDGTLQTDLWKSETSREIKKSMQLLKMFKWCKMEQSGVNKCPDNLDSSLH